MDCDCCDWGNIDCAHGCQCVNFCSDCSCHNCWANCSLTWCIALGNGTFVSWFFISLYALAIGICALTTFNASGQIKECSKSLAIWLIAFGVYLIFSVVLYFIAWCLKSMSKNKQKGRVYIKLGLFIATLLQVVMLVSGTVLYTT